VTGLDLGGGLCQGWVVIAGRSHDSFLWFHLSPIARVFLRAAALSVCHFYRLSLSQGIGCSSAKTRSYCMVSLLEICLIHSHALFGTVWVLGRWVWLLFLSCLNDRCPVPSPDRSGAPTKTESICYASLWQIPLVLPQFGSSSLFDLRSVVRLIFLSGWTGCGILAGDPPRPGPIAGRPYRRSLRFVLNLINWAFFSIRVLRNDSLIRDMSHHSLSWLTRVIDESRMSHRWVNPRPHCACSEFTI